MSQILVLDEVVDNVGVALGDIASGELIRISNNDNELVFTSVDAIPAGHKIALRAIEQDQPVLKYGYSIGSATQSILQGQYVHTHNVRSMRGKELLGEGTDHE